jgi:ribosomal protein S11
MRKLKEGGALCSFYRIVNLQKMRVRMVECGYVSIYNCNFKGMRKLYLILFLFFTDISLNAQELHLEWTRYIGGDNTCSVSGRFAIPTSDKGILFTGMTNCNNVGQMPPCSFDHLNAYIGKIDSFQQLSWLKTFGGSEDDLGNALCETSDGGYAMVVRTISYDGDVIGNHGLGDIWLLRFNHNGDLLWKKCYGGGWDEVPASIIATPENGFLISGSSTGSGGDVPGHYGPSQFYNDWFVVKTDENGNIIWSKNYGGTDDESLFGSILVINNSYYLVSKSESKDYDCTDTLWHSNVNTEFDAYVLKLDTAGNIIWSKSYGGSKFDDARHAIYDDRDSSIVFAGETSSNDFMVNNNHGSRDILVMKINLDGELQWSTCLGASNSQLGASICKADDNGYMVSGLASYGGIGAQDGWISYLNSNGEEQTSKFFGSTSNDIINSIVPYLDGFVTIGWTIGANFTEGQNIGYTSLQNISYMPLSYFDYWPVFTGKISKEENGLKVYPNPAGDELHIKSDKPIFSAVSVTDGLGREVIRQFLAGKETVLDIKNLVSGVYFIMLEGEQVKETRRFVKY